MNSANIVQRSPFLLENFFDQPRFNIDSDAGDEDTSDDALSDLQKARMLVLSQLIKETVAREPLSSNLHDEFVAYL